MEENVEGVDVVLEAKLAHGPDDVLGRDGLALLALATLVGFSSYEGDVLRHTFLHGLLGGFCYFCTRREHATHYAYHVGCRHVLILHTNNSPMGTLCSVVSSTAGGIGRVAGVSDGIPQSCWIFLCARRENNNECKPTN